MSGIFRRERWRSNSGLVEVALPSAWWPKWEIRYGGRRVVSEWAKDSPWGLALALEDLVEQLEPAAPVDAAANVAAIEIREFLRRLRLVQANPEAFERG